MRLVSDVELQMMSLCIVVQSELIFYNNPCRGELHKAGSTDQCDFLSTTAICAALRAI